MPFICIIRFVTRLKAYALAIVGADSNVKPRALQGQAVVPSAHLQKLHAVPGHQAEANVFWVIQNEIEDAFLLLGSDEVLARDLW